MYMLEEDRKEWLEKLQIAKKGVTQVRASGDHVGNGVRGFYLEGYCAGYCNAIDQISEMIGCVRD